MIRIRRIAGRLPLGRVYEIEYRPEGGTRDDGLYGATRSPTGYLEPLIGFHQSRSLAREADWQWQLGNTTGWAVEFDESAGERFRSTTPRFAFAPLSKGVGWWWLGPQLVWLALGTYCYGASISDPNPEAVGFGIGLTFFFFLFPLGLPWSIITFFLIPWLGTDHDLEEPWLAILCFAPAVLNVVLHGGYRTVRWRRIRAAKVPARLVE